MKYTKIPENTFQQLQMNAGILVSSFSPANGEIGDLLGATTGGINFTDSISFLDFGDDIDNCPKNTKELKQIESREVKMEGTFVTVDSNSARKLAAAADESSGKITPRDTIQASDFSDLWWIGDYSDVNTGANAGFLAIHLINALNTGGFQIQSGDKVKGQFAFSFTGHYSIENQDIVPYEIYVKSSDAVVTPHVLLNKHTLNLETGGTETLIAEVVPAGQTVTWASASNTVASVSGGEVTAGSNAGNTIITASITKDGVTYNDTCTVIVTTAQA